MVHELAKKLSDLQVAKLLVTSFPCCFFVQTRSHCLIFCPTLVPSSRYSLGRDAGHFKIWFSQIIQLQHIIHNAFRFHTNQLHYKLWLPHKILAFILHAPHNAFIITRSCMIPNIQAMMKTLIPVHSIDYSHNCHIVMLHFLERTNLPISHSCPRALKLF